MSYLVLARKWRPKTFSEVIGQQHVLRALINGLEQDRLHHAFLFTGTRGVGKTTLARIFAKSLNCEQGVSATPCGECDSCNEIDAGRFVDLIEVDAASRTKVEDTRELLDNVQYAPSRGRYKVYLIDEVHMLSTHSFNALLKTLEEPPPHVKFLFATTDPEKLPVTILSRCLQFTLRRLEPLQISDYLATILKQEKIKFEVPALVEIARAADGSMRDALSLLDQAISFGEGTVNTDHVHEMLGTLNQQQVLHILEALKNQDGSALLAQASELAAQGRDFTYSLDALLSALTRLATLQAVPEMEDNDSADLSAYRELSTQFASENIQLFYQIALHGKRDLPFAADPQSGFEMTLLRMLQFQPRDANTHLSATPSAQLPTQQSTPPPVAEATKQAPVQAMAEPTIAEESAAEPIIETSSTDPAPAAALELTTDTWHPIAAKLPLKGFARELADNAVFTDFNGSKLNLEIESKHEHVNSEKTKNKIAEELSKYLGSNITLIITSNEALSGDKQTIAKKKQTSKETQQKQAHDAIHNDPTIDELQQAFGAEVIENSIKPN